MTTKPIPLLALAFLLTLALGIPAAEAKVINGTNGNDTLKGTRKADHISGKKGNDKIFGKKGNDELDGGDGRDKIYDGPGNDQVTGDEGNDTIYLDKGEDQLYAEQGGDKLFITNDGKFDYIQCAIGMSGNGDTGDSVTYYGSVDGKDRLVNCPAPKVQ